MSAPNLAAGPGFIRRLLPAGLLFLGALWLGSPFLSKGLVGGGDAVWYRHQVADAVEQFRAGVFPVFTGQTHASFNGAIHPHRTAPYLQHFAGLLDLASGRQLDPHTLLGLSAFLSLMGGAAAAYFVAQWLAPNRPWRSALLAWIYVSTPGVAALVYAQDLYMSMMAVPWIPLVFGAAVKCVLPDGGRRASLVLGVSFGALWWAHSPIALWTSLALLVFFAAAAVPVARHAEARRGLLRSLLGAAAAFVMVGTYPIVSVLTLRSAGERVVPRIFDREALLAEISGAFPHTVLPLALDKPLLTFMQPGFAVAALWIGAVVLLLRQRERFAVGVWALLAVAGGYFLLMVPTSGLTETIWRSLPEFWVSMTNVWPMQRLCIVIAGAVLAAGAFALGRLERVPGVLVKLGMPLGIVLLGWTLYQADTVRAQGQRRTQPEDVVARLAFEENVNVSEYCYQQLPRRPGYFIHGVTDPGMEVRIWAEDGSRLVTSNKAAAEASASGPWMPLEFRRTANPGLVELGTPMELRPGKKYLLTFRFERETLRGVLRFKGSRLERVYVLPAAGEEKAFGTGPGQEKSLVLWTTQPSGSENVQLEFIPEGGQTGLLGLRSLGEARLSLINPESLPATVTGLVPLALHTRLEHAALVETMRVFIPGWAARVNGKLVPVQRSTEGLVAVPVPAGENDVVVTYRGSLALRAVFWINLVAGVLVMLSVAGFLVRFMVRRVWTPAGQSAS